MSDYKVYSIETAPEKSKPALQGLKQNFGLVPNLAATMAGSPVLINGFVGAFGNFHGGSFTGAERQVLLLTNAVTNRSAWAVAFHSTMALKEGVDPADVQALRERRVPKDAKLAALSELTRQLIEKRGHLADADISAFREAGFGRDQV
ncbi:MAG TPA: carboxymuconolactone decarboxylase family protein, partial [Stellaceae bacterium]|nr:carboxymuconolactone decarboxylase family protein [Stellaceae bacterium]